MIKLIASDLDGTLLQDGTQELTPRAISLIHSLTQKGIYFVAASGRQYTNERIVFDKIKDEISYIGENGSICMHQGKLIFRGTIRDDLAYRIIREVKKSDHFEIIVSREDTCLIEDRNPEFVDHIVNVMHNKTEIVEDLSQINGPFLKIAICNMIEGRSREEMRQEEQARWEEMSIEEHMEHYLAQGMNRKDAMKQTAKDRGMQKREVYNYLEKIKE